MPLKKVLLVRPKAKKFLLAYQPNEKDINSTKYLNFLYPAAANGPNLYSGIKPDNSTNTDKKNNIDVLVDFIDNNNLLKGAHKPDLIISCESFLTNTQSNGIAMSQSNGVTSSYASAIEKLKSKRIPFLVNAAIKDRKEKMVGVYSGILDLWQQYLGIAMAQNSNFIQSERANFNALPNDISCSRSVFCDAFDTPSTAYFYKYNYDVPTLTSEDIYVKGLFESRFSSPPLDADFFIKICNDAGNNYYLQYDIQDLRISTNTKKIFVNQADSFVPWWTLSCASDKVISLTKQDGTVGNIDPVNYPWFKKLVFKPKPLVGEEGKLLSNFASLLPYINYFVCADTEGWRHDMDTPVANLTYENIKQQIGNPDYQSPFCNVNPLRNYFKNGDNSFYTFEQLQDSKNKIRSSYCNDKGEPLQIRDFWDYFMEYNANDAKKEAIQKEFGIDISKEFDQKALYDHIIKGNSNRFKVHLYSPNVGNIYRVSRDGDNYAISQALRMFDYYGNLCDYGLFDLTQDG